MQESILETNKDMGDSEQQRFDDDVEGVADTEHVDTTTDTTNLGGGKKRRKSRRRSRGKPRHRVTRHRGTKNKTRSKKPKKSHRKGPSKWILHVKAFCKRTGKTFPEALKDPMCRKSFKH